jgi:hypothetical protein
MTLARVRNSFFARDLSAIAQNYIGFETVAFKHPETRKRLALAHTIAADETVAAAVRTARDSMAVALHAVI